MWLNSELLGVRLWKCGSIALGGAANPTLISEALTGEIKAVTESAVATAIALTNRMSATSPYCALRRSVGIVVHTIEPLNDGLPTGASGSNIAWIKWLFRCLYLFDNLNDRRRPLRRHI